MLSICCSEPPPRHPLGLPNWCEATKINVMALEDESTLPFTIFIQWILLCKAALAVCRENSPKPACTPLTLYESVANNILKSESLCSIFPLTRVTTVNSVVLRSVPGTHNQAPSLKREKKYWEAGRQDTSSCYVLLDTCSKWRAIGGESLRADQSMPCALSNEIIRPRDHGISSFLLRRAH